MFDTGLVSITFREKTVEELIREAAACGLMNIEWGSDVHAPYNDPQQLQKIVSLQKQYGVSCCSYGTYFYLGESDLEELPGYIRAAKLLGCRILRLWAGKKSSHEWTQDEKKVLFTQCRKAAKMAEDADVVLCLECHKNTFTDAGDSSFELMKAVDSKAFRMYWQPNSGASLEENIAYARLIKDYTVNIHVFHWKDYQPYPLEEGIDEWQQYLREFDGDHLLLLELMPDDQGDRLSKEADSLHKLIGK